MASFYFGKTLMSISSTFSVIRKTTIVLLFNKKIVANCKTYHIINLMGSVLVTIDVSFLLLYHFIILDTMWIIISGCGIYQNIYNDENEENEEEKI